MRDAVKSRVANDVALRKPQEELEQYLAAPLEEVDNVVAWWGVCLFYLNILQTLINTICSTTLFNTLPSPALQKTTLPFKALLLPPNVLFQAVVLLELRAAIAYCRRHLRHFNSSRVHIVRVTSPQQLRLSSLLLVFTTTWRRFSVLTSHSLPTPRLVLVPANSILCPRARFHAHPFVGAQSLVFHSP